MKKVLAFILCLMMALSLCSASAESITLLAEEIYEGVWVQFEDGFELYIPADWYEYECTPELNADGIFYMAGTEDLSYYCTLGWVPLEAECTIDELQAEFAAAYSDAQITEVNDVALVYYVDAENNMLNFLALDGTEPGVYMFAFSPADDEDFAVVAALIASTIRCF